jgi:hypothetical protein
VCILERRNRYFWTVAKSGTWYGSWRWYILLLLLLLLLLLVRIDIIVLRMQSRSFRDFVLHITRFITDDMARFTATAACTLVTVFTTTLAFAAFVTARTANCNDICVDDGTPDRIQTLIGPIGPRTCE